MNVHNLTATAAALSGGGKAQDLYRAAAPRSILEHIINFFTFGGVRRKHTADIDAFTQAFSGEISRVWDGRSPMPGTIRLEFEGVLVTFKVRTYSPNDVQIKVSGRYERMYEETTVDADTFEKVTTVLWLRERYNIPQSQPPITQSGKMNLRNLRLEGANLSGMRLNSADFSGCQLQNANFRSANISQALFYDADIYGCDFSYANCYMSRFLKCDTSWANFEHVNYNNMYALKKPPLFDNILFNSLKFKKEIFLDF